MEINSLSSIFYLLTFIVPGFIWHSTYLMFVPQKVEYMQISILRFLLFSAINYSLWSWLIYLLIQPAFSVVCSAIIWWLIIFISPIILGMLCGHFNKKDYVRKGLQKIGLNPIHVIPTGWDYQFSKLEGYTWVIVTLIDGSTVAGLFSSNSFASSEQTERDVYIEEVYSIDDYGAWIAVDRSNGILVKGEQIRYIEFFNNTEGGLSNE